MMLSVENGDDNDVAANDDAVDEDEWWTVR